MTLPGSSSVGANGWSARSGERGLSGLVWIGCCQTVVAIGLEKVLEKEFWVHRGQESPEGSVPSCVVLCANVEDGLSERIEGIQGSNPGVLVLVFGTRADLSLARAALKAGARGFVHAGMAPSQIIRAFKVALEGEIVAPRGLLEYVLLREETPSLDLLSPRQREILRFVADGLSNAQIARRVFLSPFTVKQHLRTAYKLLGVKNRTEAARLVRNRG